MNYVAFTNSAVFSSELYSAFLANKVSERLVIFENILSLKEITAFYTETKKIIKELDKSKSETVIKLKSVEAEINAIKNTPSKPEWSMVKNEMLSTEERALMYDLAGEKKEEVAPDIPRYIKDHDYVAAALRTARDLGASEKDWLDFVDELKRRKG